MILLIYNILEMILEWRREKWVPGIRKVKGECVERKVVRAMEDMEEDFKGDGTVLYLDWRWFHEFVVKLSGTT